MVAAICQAQRLAALGTRLLALNDALETVLVPSPIASVACHAVRGLLDSILHNYPLHECARVGVHLWQARGGDSPGFLLIADGRRVPDKPPQAGNAEMAGIRSALGAEGMCLDRERCAGTVWRVTLPKFGPLERDAP